MQRDRGCIVDCSSSSPAPAAARLVDEAADPPAGPGRVPPGASIPGRPGLSRPRRGRRPRRDDGADLRELRLRVEHLRRRAGRGRRVRRGVLPRPRHATLQGRSGSTPAAARAATPVSSPLTSKPWWPWTARARWRRPPATWRPSPTSSWSGPTCARCPLPREHRHRGVPGGAAPPRGPQRGVPVPGTAAGTGGRILVYLYSRPARSGPAAWPWPRPVFRASTVRTPHRVLRLLSAPVAALCTSASSNSVRWAGARDRRRSTGSPWPATGASPSAACSSTPSTG